MRYLLLYLAAAGAAFPALSQPDSTLLLNSWPDTIQEGMQQSRTKPSFLSGGAIDIVQNGIMNASARILRIFIGEPGKFQVPVTLHTGVTANQFNGNQPEEELAITLVNPGLGLFSLNFEGDSKVAGKRENITALHLYYHTGLRYLSVYNRNLYRNISFFNLISGIGITFVTGAWERNNAGSVGTFWMSIRGLLSHTSHAVFEEIFSQPVLHDILACSGTMGIEISAVVKVKASYYRGLNNRDVPSLSKPLLQLSFNYSIK